MKLKDFFNKSVLIRLLCISLISPMTAQATTVEVQTTAGNFVINLFDFDEDVKATVDNFLQYVNAGLYDDTYFHRLVPTFVLQGGGFVYGGSFPAPQDTDLNLQEVELVPGQDNPTIDNQPKYSNVLWTVAMAKLSGQPNSATNQWFINLNNNAGTLDTQVAANRLVPGFTVFGIVESGRDVVEALTDFTLLLPSYASPLSELPVQNYTNDDFTNNVVPNQNNLALITAIVVLDSTIDTASHLTIVPNDLGQGLRPTPTIPQQDFEEGGNVGLIFIIFLAGLLVLRRKV